MRELEASVALLSAWMAAGCGGDPERQPPPCPAWTRATATGTCVDRAWTPALSVTAEDGARSVSAAVDGRGLAVLAWQAFAGVGSTIAIADETTPGTWAVQFASSSLDGGSAPPHVAASPAGDAVVAWKQTVGETGGVFASERDASGSWTHPDEPVDRISFPPTAYEPRAAFGADGELVLVWNQWDVENFGVAFARRPPGGTLERPESPSDVLSPKSFYSNAPQIALGPDGAALVTWYQSSGGGPLMVYASERASSDAAPSRPDVSTFLSAPGAPVDSHPVANPRPAIGPSGEAAIAWTQEDGAGAIAVYLATRDAAGAWTEPVDLADAFSVRSGIARCTQIAFGSDGDLWVAWYADAAGGGHAVHLAHRDPAGAWLFPGDAPLVLSTAGADGITPSLAAGRGGGAVIAWTERAGDGPFRIVSSMLRPARDGGAVSPTHVLSSDSGDAAEPSVAIGSDADRAVVAWAQGGLGSERVFASTLP